MKKEQEQTWLDYVGKTSIEKVFVHDSRASYRGTKLACSQLRIHMLNDCNLDEENYPYKVAIEKFLESAEGIRPIPAEDIRKAIKGEIPDSHLVLPHDKKHVVFADIPDRRINSSMLKESIRFAKGEIQFWYVPPSKSSGRGILVGKHDIGTFIIATALIP